MENNKNNNEEEELMDFTNMFKKSKKKKIIKKKNKSKKNDKESKNIDNNENNKDTENDTLKNADDVEENHIEGEKRPKKIPHYVYGIKCNNCACKLPIPLPYNSSLCYCTHPINNHINQPYEIPYGECINIRIIPRDDGCACFYYVPTPFNEDICYCNDIKDIHPIYNIQLLKSWVGQSGPSCAAATIATAYNTFNKIDKYDKNALQQQNILDIYEIILINQLGTKQNFIYKLLNPTALNEIENELRKYCIDNVFN